MKTVTYLAAVGQGQMKVRIN